MAKRAGLPDQLRQAAKRARNTARCAKDDVVDSPNFEKLFDALATSNGIRTTEFALILRVEFKARIMKALNENPELRHDGTDPFQNATDSVIKRAIGDRFDVVLSKVLEMVFRVMDRNQDGMIDKAEFQEFEGSMKRITAAQDPITGCTALADFYFKVVDKNGDGKISLDEVQDVIHRYVELVSTVVTGCVDIFESVISSPEIANQLSNTGIVALRPDDPNRDPNEILRRAELPELLQGALEAGWVEDVFASLAPMLGDRDLKAQLVKLLKLARESLAEFDASFGAQFYVRAMEWFQGGVDEATFVCRVVPMMRGSKDQRLEKLKSDDKDALKGKMSMMSGSLPTISEQQNEVATNVIQMLVEKEGLVPALVRGTLRAQEHDAELARAFFQFLDLDGSGRISTQEIRLLKAMLDGLLHLGERACHDIAESGLVAREGSVADVAKELAFAVFDILDKDGNGMLSIMEVIAFGQKFLLLVLQCFKYTFHSVECHFDEVFKALAADAWKQQGIDEVSKDQFTSCIIQAFMMFMMMMHH